jgi:hypothetical protein
MGRVVTEDENVHVRILAIVVGALTDAMLQLIWTCASKLEHAAVLVVVFVNNETVVAAQRDATEPKQENSTGD